MNELEEVKAKLAETEKKYAESQAENDALKKQNAEFAEAKKKAEDEAKKARIVSFSEKMITDGKLDPKDKDDFVSFAMSLDESETLAFSEGKKSRLDFLFSFAEKRGGKVKPDGKPAYTSDKAAAGKDPLKFSEGVDEERAELDEKARQYREEHPEASYSEAVLAVVGK